MSAMNKFVKFAIILSVMALGSGCSGNMPIVTDQNSLCKDWGPYLPRTGDKLTDESAEELLENNEARVVWGCDRFERRAMS